MRPARSATRKRVAAGPARLESIASSGFGRFSASSAALRHLAGQMSAHLQKFLNEHNTAFTDIDMPVDAALRLISVAVERFIDTKFATEVSFEVPDDVLQGFPEPVRTFFQPASAERPRLKP